MKLLKEYIRRSLARRHMGHQMVGAVALNTVRAILDSQKHTKSVKSVTSLDDREDERDEFMEFVEDQSGLE